MKKTRLNNGLWPVLILTLVVAVCTALLSLTNAVTEPVRAQVKRDNELRSKLELYPDASEFEALTVPEEYADSTDFINVARGESGELLGLLIQARSKGYGGQVPVLAAFNPEGKITGIVMPPNDETPGLGQKVREEKFYAQFVAFTSNDRFSPYDVAGGLTVAAAAPANNTGNAAGRETWYKADAVSGATLSSKGVCEAMNNAAALFNLLIGEVQ